jgi:hypothetical protein
MKALDRLLLLHHATFGTASPQYFPFFLPTQHPPNAPRIFAPLLQFLTLTLTFPENVRTKSTPDDHSACDDCAEQEEAKVPVGDGGDDEAKDAEEDAEMGASGVRVVCEAVECRARWPCVHAYQGRESSWVERDCCADSDAPR